MLRLLPLLFLFLVPSAAAQNAGSQEDILVTVSRLEPLVMDEVLWLARCLYSESDRADEQRLVAWVVRNRVETKFRGSNYREVVLEPRQFSAFNRPSDRRTYILGLDQHATAPSWKRTLRVAYDVYGASASKRPFAVTTRHFYSPISMSTEAAPNWADPTLALSSEALGVDPERFRFFSGVDDNEEPGLATHMSARDRIDAAASRRTTFSIRARSFSGRVPRPRRPSTKVGSH